jgi:hypothetical protein
MLPNWHAASRARPRRCADTISLMAGARAVLAGRRRLQHAGPLVVRAAARITEGTRWEMDRRRDRRTWRSPRHHPRKLLADRLSRGRRGGEAFLKPASFRGARSHPTPVRPVGAGRIAGSRSSALCDVASRLKGTAVERILQRRGITALHRNHGGSCASILAATIGRMSIRRPKPGRR